MPNDIEQKDEHARFEQLLPFYVTNQLSDADRGFIQAYVATNPTAKKALQFTERLNRIVSSTGANRDTELALSRLLTDSAGRKRLSLRKRLILKLRALGISPPLAIALLVIVGQGIGYAAHKMNLFGVARESVISPAEADLSITLKRSADLAAVATILERFGATIVHSSTVGDAQKIFISIIDKTRIQALIDAIMELGIVDSAAVLL